MHNEYYTTHRFNLIIIIHTVKSVLHYGYKIYHKHALEIKQDNLNRSRLVPQLTMSSTTEGP
jgi:hypothetical protein